MGKPDDISSTEKLLEMIRQNQPSLEMEAGASAPVQPIAPATSDPQGAPKKIKAEKPAVILPFWPNGKSVKVGIDLQSTGIAMVMASPKGARAASLKTSFIPYDLTTPLPEAGLLPALLAADWFPDFLKKALDDFRGPDRKLSYWLALPREAVETHNITIPKVPAQEVANTVFWTTVKEIAFEQETRLLDFQTVKEIQAEGGSKTLTIVYLAARREIEGLRELFDRIGHSLTGLASSAAAFHNELRQANLAAKDENFAHLFLGEEKSYIAIFSEGHLIFRRDINTGIGSLVESLMEKGADQGVILDDAGCRQLLFSANAATNMSDTWKGLLTEDQTLFDLELPAAVRLVRQLERTLDYCKNNFAVPRASLIMLDGVSFSSSGLAAYFAREIGIDCQVHKPLAAVVSLQDHRLLTAFGMALSDQSATQNFLQTHEQKGEARQIGRLNNAIVATTLVILLTCVGLFCWQRVQIHAKENQLAALVDRIGQHTPAADFQEVTDRLTEGLHRLNEGQQDKLTLARRFFPVAVAGKIISNLPKQIMLTSLTLEAGQASLAKPADTGEDVNMAAAVPDVPINVALQGIVMGPRQNMEFELARYLRTITTSSVIRSAKVAAKETTTYKRQEVLRFNVDGSAGLLAAENRMVTD